MGRRVARHLPSPHRVGGRGFAPANPQGGFRIAGGLLTAEEPLTYIRRDLRCHAMPPCRVADNPPLSTVLRPWGRKAVGSLLQRLIHPIGLSVW
jgi:hypothetical protein